MVLDAIYRGELLPCENNLEGNSRHKQAGKEIEQLLKDLRNNLSEEDMALVDQMLEQTPVSYTHLTLPTIA